MLGEFFCNPVLPAGDGDRARRFYRDVLGLGLASGPTDDPMFFSAGGGSAVVVTEIPGREPSGYPVVSFLVTDIERVVDGLVARGVEFVAPSTSTFAGVEGTVGGYVTDYGPVKSAILRDSEGNVLALNEIVQDR
jgi:catechol 2,3-dioxygenase-like lactoylglutathione lyase family enzyme